MLQCSGILDFEPLAITKKHHSQHWKHTAIVKVDCDIHSYYSWFLLKRFNLKLNKPLRQAHVTFISDRIENLDLYKECAKKWHDKKVDFQYDNVNVRSSGEHWWLRVYSKELEDLREECGLDRVPYLAFHLTMGMANEKNIDHSNYIVRQCLRFPNNC